MGPLFWRHPDTGLKKCSERTGNSCDLTETDGCCAVTACEYCLELDIYGEDPVFSESPATFTGSGWAGSVGGYSFFGYWERNIYTDECEFIVLFDGEEIYRKSCYQGQSCRDSSDSAEVTIGYDDAILYWSKVTPLPLPHIIDPDTGCKTWFCGECDCSCETLCATITEPYGDVYKGELDNVAYECEGPVWAGYIGHYNLQLTLARDIYGQCILEVNVDGEELDPVYVTGCKNLSAIIELNDGTVISVKCKICSCESLYNSLCCPEPLGPVVYVTGGLIVGSVALTCENCTAENQEDYIVRVYTGEYVTDWMYAVGYGSLCSVTHNWKAKIRLFFTWTCGSGMNLSIHASVAENAPGYDVAVLDATVVENVVVECSPLLNVYENLCPANDWFFAPNACIGAIARCTEFPETYVVTE